MLKQVERPPPHRAVLFLFFWGLKIVKCIFKSSWPPNPSPYKEALSWVLLRTCLILNGTSDSVIVIAPSQKNSKTNSTPTPVWRLLGVAQAIETYHVHCKEDGNAAVGVVWPREVHPKRHYREGGSEAKTWVQIYYLYPI